MYVYMFISIIICTVVFFAGPCHGLSSQLSRLHTNVSMYIHMIHKSMWIIIYICVCIYVYPYLSIDKHLCLCVSAGPCHGLPARLFYLHTYMFMYMNMIIHVLIIFYIYVCIYVYIYLSIIICIGVYVQDHAMDYQPVYFVYTHTC